MQITECRWTQLPNDFIDAGGIKLVGPAAACIYWCIARQTKGWQKIQDAISYSDIQELTGFSRATVSLAIKKLIEHELIEAEKGAGRTSEYRLKIFTSSKIEPVPVQKLNQLDPASSTNNRDPSNMSSSNQIKERERKLDNSTTPSSGTQVHKPQSSVEKDLGKKAKICLDYYFEKHVAKRGFDPMIEGGRDMNIFKRILKADYTVEAIKQVIDFFFDYDKRSKFTTRALYNSFDTLYGVLKDRVEGRR